MLSTDSYPLVDELPPVIDTRKWEWTRGRLQSACGGFFVGTDESGIRWLTKMRGAFRGYRELVFERLVQRAGWLCQSSAFAIIERCSLPGRVGQQNERIQIVTRLLPEHVRLDCTADCPVDALRGHLNDPAGDPLALITASSLGDSLNIARAQILAPILGGIEPAGYLVTVDHKVFLIDGELMFADPPSDVRSTSWWTSPNGSPSLAGERLIRQVCKAIGSFQDEDLERFLESPAELKIELGRPIRPLLYKARDYARTFAG
jgi:hypothetical protein